VTQTADVEVKRALIKGVNSPDFDETGSMSNRVPRIINPAKPYIRTREDELPVFVFGSTGSTTRHGLLRCLAGR
jgi:hypothetical protein